MRNRNVAYPFALVTLFALVAHGCTLTSPNDGAGGSGANGESGSGNSAGSSSGPKGACMMTAPLNVPAPPAAGATKLPCDIYAEDGGPCVAAHSTVRALYSSYAGPLYQVRKGDGTTKDIGLLAPGGYANSTDQDMFCGADSCTISIIYDQSGWANHLTKAPAGGAKPTPDNEANAKSVSATFGGHKVYGVHVVTGIGYRNNAACGTATGDKPETMYMVAAADFYNGGCCFDYGNMERNSRDNGEGTMEAVYYGTCQIWGRGRGKKEGAATDGPWVMGDLENGLWAGDSSPYTPSEPISGMQYVTGMVKGDSASGDKPDGHWTIKVGNAQSGELAVPFDGKRPSKRYNPMRKEGAIGMGTGGDNSSGAMGNFFEGVMTAHYSSKAADDAVQANIVAAYTP